MKKYSRICLLFCFLFLWHNRIVYADDTEIRIMVNQQEKTLTWKPMLFENDVMIALEDFGRILEADVVWDETGQRFAIGYNGCILMEDIANETEVVWNDDGETCFPLQGIKKCFYLKKQDQFFVSIRSLGELLGIENFYDETEQVVYLTCSSAGENKVTSEDILCMDMQRYVWKNQEEQFDTASEDMQEFYDQRISWMDAVAMGSSDIWEGVKDLASPMTNAEDRIKDSLETVLASLPENDFVAVDHELYDFLKDAVMNVNATTDELLGIEQQLLEIIPKLKPLKESIKNLDDVIGDMSLLYDVTASSLDAVAILLSNYEKNIGYLDVLESALQESNRLDETLKNSIVVLREEYTNKFAQLFFKTRDDLTKFTISNIADVATGGVFSIGEFAWKAFFGAIGINSKGEALKLFYGLLYMNGSLDTAYKNQYVIVQELESNQEEAEKLRQLDDLQRAVKKNMYQCIRTVTNDKDTQEYCKIKEKEYSESCLSWDKVVYITEGRSGGEGDITDTFEDNSDLEYSDLRGYDCILNMFYTNISQGWSALDGIGTDNVMDPDSVSYLFYHMSEYSLSETGYAFMDLDNNGQDELFVSSFDVAYDGMFYDLYTIIEGEIIHLISGGERDRYYLTQKNTINNVGSGGAELSSNVNYYLDSLQRKLRVNEAVLYDGDKDSENPWFYALEEYYDESTYEKNYDVLTSITEEEARKIQDSFPKNVPLDLIPFDELYVSGGTGKGSFVTKQEVQKLLDDYFNGKSDGSVIYEVSDVIDKVDDTNEYFYYFTLRSCLSEEAAQELIEAGGSPTPNKLIGVISVDVQTGQAEIDGESFQLW